MWKGHDVQQTEEFSYLIFMKCVLNSFELGGEKGRKTHTKKDRQLKTPVEKLTLVIWAPKLEGFAFNTSAENFTSQRKKGKNKTRVEERGKKKKSKHYYTSSLSESANYYTEQSGTKPSTLKGLGRSEAPLQHIYVYVHSHGLT